MLEDIKVNDKIIFKENEREEFIVQVVDDRYIIATGMFEVDTNIYPEYDGEYKEKFYTIIDKEEYIRGPHNMIFNDYDFDSKEGMEELVRDLHNDKLIISKRHQVDISIYAINGEIKVSV